MKKDKLRVNTTAIKIRMEERDLNIDSLRKRIGVGNWGNLSRLLNGETMMVRFAMMGRICKELHMTPNEFLTDTDDKPEPQWPHSQRLYTRVFGSAEKK